MNEKNKTTKPPLGAREPLLEPLHEPMLIDAEEVARLLGVTKSTVDKWRKQNVGPDFIRLPAAGSTKYTRQDVNRWIRGLIQPGSPHSARAVRAALVAEAPEPAATASEAEASPWTAPRRPTAKEQARAVERVRELEVQVGSGVLGLEPTLNIIRRIAAGETLPNDDIRNGVGGPGV